MRMKQSELLTATHGKAQPAYSHALIFLVKQSDLQSDLLALVEDGGAFIADDLPVSLTKNLYNSGSLIDSS